MTEARGDWFLVFKRVARERVVGVFFFGSRLASKKETVWLKGESIEGREKKKLGVSLITNGLPRVCKEKTIKLFCQGTLLR